VTLTAPRCLESHVDDAEYAADDQRATQYPGVGIQRPGIRYLSTDPATTSATRDTQNRPSDGVVAGHGPQLDAADDEDQAGENRDDHADEPDDVRSSCQSATKRTSPPVLSTTRASCACGTAPRTAPDGTAVDRHMSPN
jgi:hypothetical protein